MILMIKQLHTGYCTVDHLCRLEGEVGELGELVNICLAWSISVPPRHMSLNSIMYERVGDRAGFVLNLLQLLEQPDRTALLVFGKCFF